MAVADPFVPLPQAPATAKAAGVSVSYHAAWRGAAAGEFLTIREGRSYLAGRDDFLRWASERQAERAK